MRELRVNNYWIWLFVVLGILLITQRWFWLIAGALGAVASFFAVCASVIHFEILGAMGFFLLMIGCGIIFRFAND